MVECGVGLGLVPLPVYWAYKVLNTLNGNGVRLGKIVRACPRADNMTRIYIDNNCTNKFAAANVIIDALCNHITELEGGRSHYESVFAAIHRRRLNWIPILQMQKYCSIAEVTLDLRKVAERKIKEREEFTVSKQCDTEVNGDFADMASSNSVESSDNGGSDVVDGDSSRDDSHDSPESVITDIGSQTQPMLESVEFCSNHENCGARPTHMKMTKGFVSKEPVRGHMVNVVRGLKLFEDIFTPNEISKLHDLVNKLRVAGQNSDLSGGSCDSWHSYS
ncbi:hypothetical protein K7X08_029737 [Anisodus acutangulus]|uniref:Uncharacterized protein n=1 Tax=Anisodus acutangulus TaxID=402998 RepID=A0A9Q1L2I5_9SOLA|nr:hypothetical protein K7X08_029737 [Anisodus acutangulus]